MSPAPEKVSPLGLEAELKDLRVRIREILDPALEGLRTAEVASNVSVVGFLVDNTIEEGGEGRQYVHPLVLVNYGDSGFSDKYFALGGFGLKVAKHAIMLGMTSRDERVRVEWGDDETKIYGPNYIGQFLRGDYNWVVDNSGPEIFSQGQPTVMAQQAKTILEGLRAAAGLRE